MPDAMIFYVPLPAVAAPNDFVAWVGTVSCDVSGHQPFDVPIGTKKLGPYHGTEGSTVQVSFAIRDNAGNIGVFRTQRFTLIDTNAPPIPDAIASLEVVGETFDGANSLSEST